MTYRQEAEKYRSILVNLVNPGCRGGVVGCPRDADLQTCKNVVSEEGCRKCWDREIPGTEPLGKWKIVTTFYDHNFKAIGYETYGTYYKNKSSATRRARQLWGLNPFVSWVVKPTEG